MVTWLNFTLPPLLWYLWINLGRDAATQALYNDNSYYDYGWRWISDGSIILWGAPSVLWTLSRFIEGQIIPLLLLLWWGSLQTFFTPVVFLFGPLSMLLGLRGWNSSWDEAFSKAEIISVALSYLSFGSASYLLFLQYWTDALLFYDDAL